MNIQLRNELISMCDEDQEMLGKLADSGEHADYKDDMHPKLKKLLREIQKEQKK
jgi:hypothetical protein